MIEGVPVVPMVAIMFVVGMTAFFMGVVFAQTIGPWTTEKIETMVAQYRSLNELKEAMRERARLVDAKVIVAARLVDMSIEIVDMCFEAVDDDSHATWDNVATKVEGYRLEAETALKELATEDMRA